MVDLKTCVYIEASVLHKRLQTLGRETSPYWVCCYNVYVGTCVFHEGFKLWDGKHHHTGFIATSCINYQLAPPGGEAPLRTLCWNIQLLQVKFIQPSSKTSIVATMLINKNV